MKKKPEKGWIDIENKGNSITFGGLLTIVFIVFKITGHLNWSWIWVFSPLWIGFLINVMIIVSIFGYVKLKEK